MPTYQTPPTLANGNTWSASQHNTYYRDNMQALYDAGRDPGMRWISNLILGGSSASVSFSDIPQQYKHLMLSFVARGTNASTAVDVRLTFNDDTGNNYDWQEIHSNGGSVATFDGIAVAFALIAEICAASTTAGWAGSCISHIHGYSTVGLWKAIRNECEHRTADSSTGVHMMTNSGIWRSSTPIKKLTLTPSAGSFAAGSRFSIYGWM